MRIHHTEIKSFASTHTQWPNKSIPSCTGIKSSSIFHTEIKSISTHTKLKSISMHIQIWSDFRPASIKHIDVDPPRNNQINFIPAPKSSQIWPPYDNQVNLGCPQKNKHIFMLILRTSHIRPALKNQVNFDPHAKNPVSFDPNIKTNLFSGCPQYRSLPWPPHKKTSQVRSLRSKQVQFEPEQWNQVNFAPIAEIKSNMMLTPISSRFRRPDATPVNFDPDAKCKPLSTSTQKPNQCRSTTLKWSHFQQPTHENQIHFILH